MIPLRTSIRLLLGLVLLALFHCLRDGLAFSHAFAPNADTTMEVKGERGITGSVVFDYSGKGLRSKTQRDSVAPIWIRLSVSPKDPHHYEAKFLGTVEGVYDLCSLMEHADGSEVTEIIPIQVRIVSTLPKDHRSDLFEVAEFQPSFWGGYRLAIMLVCLAWLGIPIVVFIRRALRAVPPVNLTVAERPPTFADQLQPLIEAAASRTLSIREKGRLELLLLHYWRERTTPKSTDIAGAIRGLRTHPEAGTLVTTVERWLHQSDSLEDESDRSPEAIVELLKPYRSLAAVDESNTRSKAP